MNTTKSYIVAAKAVELFNNGFGRCVLGNDNMTFEINKSDAIWEIHDLKNHRMSITYRSGLDDLEEISKGLLDAGNPRLYDLELLVSDLIARLPDQRNLMERDEVSDYCALVARFTPRFGLTEVQVATALACACWGFQLKESAEWGFIQPEQSLNNLASTTLTNLLDMIASKDNEYTQDGHYDYRDLSDEFGENGDD